MNPDPSTSVRDVRVPVKVWGMDSGGHAFRADATAHERTLQGGRLDGVVSVLAPGEIIGVQCGDQKSRFRVVWIGQPNSSQAGQVGVKALEAGRCIWPIEVPQDTASASQASSTVSLRQERRQHNRYLSEGNVEMGPVGSEIRTWGKLADISMGGCYVETALPSKLGSELQIKIHTKNGDVSLVGIVRTAVTNLGMGMEFSGFAGDSRERLDEMVAQISGARLQGQTEPAPVTSIPAATPTPLPSSSNTLVTAVEQFFEGNNVLTREEFLTLVEDVRGKDRSAQ